MATNAILKLRDCTRRLAIVSAMFLVSALNCSAADGASPTENEQAAIDHFERATRLTYRHNGRDHRLTDIHGNVVREILA